MKRALILAATIASISIPGVMASLLVASPAVAEDTPLKQAILGAWSPVKIVNIAADGRKSSAWDSTPKGILMFDGHHFSQTLVRSDLPNYASGDRMKDTPEENTATAPSGASRSNPRKYSTRLGSKLADIKMWSICRSALDCG